MYIIYVPVSLNKSKLFILLQSSNIKALSFWCQPQDTLANAMASSFTMSCNYGTWWG